MTAPRLETRVVQQFRAPGTTKWYASRRAALLKAAFVAMKAKCQANAAGHYCDAENTRCWWHSSAPLCKRFGSGTNAAHVAHRLVRLWMREPLP